MSLKELDDFLEVVHVVQTELDSVLKVIRGTLPPTAGNKEQAPIEPGQWIVRPLLNAVGEIGLAVLVEL